MRTLSSLSLAFSIACGVQAQPTFERMYQSGTSYSFNLNELPSGRIFTSMAASHLLNTQGFIEHSSYYHSGGTYLTQTLRPVALNRFYFTTSTPAVLCPGSSSGNLSLTHPVIGKMDTLGATWALHKYELNNGICYGPAGGLEITADQGALIWGMDKSFYALRVDTDLDPVWSMRVMRSGGFKFLKELPGGDLLAGVNMDTAGVVVARLNADGEFLWSKSYLRPRGMIHDALIEPDGSVVLLGFTDSTASTNIFVPPPPTYQPKLFMLKVDANGEVLWCKAWQSIPNTWYVRSWARITSTLDGNYAVLANTGYPQYNYPNRPFLMKTSTNGDTLWTRTVGVEAYSYLVQDLLAYSDGGYMINGIIYGDLPDLNSGLNYIYKTDSLGRFSCLDEPYPVVASDLFPVDSSFTLTAVFSSAIATPISVVDSILDPSLFTTWDACEYANHVPLRMERNRPMRILPNPNTGRFTMAFADPLMAQSYFSVYDALGKLLYQRPLPARATLEEVDLSRLGAGTYVIKLTSPEGSCFERVVVE